MIHYGKHSDGELEIRVSADKVANLWKILRGKGDADDATFGELRNYIEDNYTDELNETV